MEDGNCEDAARQVCETVQPGPEWFSLRMPAGLKFNSTKFIQYKNSDSMYNTFVCKHGCKYEMYV